MRAKSWHGDWLANEQNRHGHIIAALSTTTGVSKQGEESKRTGVEGEGRERKDQNMTKQEKKNQIESRRAREQIQKVKKGQEMEKHKTALNQS